MTTPLKVNVLVTVFGLSGNWTCQLTLNLNRLTMTTAYKQAKEKYIAELGKGNWHLKVYDVKIEVVS